MLQIQKAYLCLLVYHIPRDFIPFSLLHGNAKSSKPFIPKWPSTMKLIKDEIQQSGPKEVVASVSAKVSGVLQAYAPGEFPRGELIQSALLSSKMMLMNCLPWCKNQRQVTAMYETSSHPLIQLLLLPQMSSLTRFCASSAGVETCIMKVDPTFCLGEFDYVSPPLNCYPKEQNAPCVHWTDSHPLQKDFCLILILCVISGVTEVWTSVFTIIWIWWWKGFCGYFVHEFWFAIYLFCSIHARNNVKKKIERSKIPRKCSEWNCRWCVWQAGGLNLLWRLSWLLKGKSILPKTGREKGAVGKKEKEHPACPTGFYDWFCQHQCEPIVSGMLRHIREDAGLGVPPSPFTTKAVGGGLVSPAMAGPVFDYLSVKSRHTVYWACAISTTLRGFFWPFSSVYLAIASVLCGTSLSSPTHPPCGCLLGHLVTISTIISWWPDQIEFASYGPDNQCKWIPQCSYQEKGQLQETWTSWICEAFEELIDEQQWELEHAIIGQGKYVFREEYKYLEVHETDWFRMTKQRRSTFKRLPMLGWSMKVALKKKLINHSQLPLPYLLSNFILVIWKYR